MRGRSKLPDPAASAAPSYVCGVADTPLLYLTIGEVLARAARADPDGEALVVIDQAVRWTWAELSRRVDAMAAGLIALGLEPGDRLGIWAPNCAEWIITQLATARAGIILVTINPAYRTAELEHALNLSGCRALVIAQRFKTSDYVMMLREVAPDIADGMARSARLPALEFCIAIGDPPPGFLAFQAVAKAGDGFQAALAERAATLSPDDPINIQFTSGTTGAPKGATLTQNNIVNNGYQVGEGMRLTAADRICIPVPLYHCFGMVMGVLDAATHGAAMIFPGEAFDPGATLAAVAAERCTALYGVPTMFVAMFEHPGFADFDVATLRTGIMAGALCPVPLMERVVADLHMRDVTICYGMTETSPVSFQTRIDSDLASRCATVGTIHPFLEAKVVDTAGGIVPRGDMGELLVRGYSVMRGYWHDPERTGEVIDAGGWMHSGDLATIDDAGRCRIVGRIKDMIVRGGENIYPAEIENFLRMHPDVVDVAVLGVPDDRFGEAVCAFIIARRDLEAAQIQDFCKGRIAHFKIPGHVRIVDAFPMTVTGKVQKFVMAQAFSDEMTNA